MGAAEEDLARSFPLEGAELARFYASLGTALGEGVAAEKEALSALQVVSLPG